jgi:hypothetical protein
MRNRRIFCPGVGKRLVSVVESNRELSVPHSIDDGAIHFEGVTLWHQSCAPIRINVG